MTTEATTYPPLIGTPPACEMMGGISRSRLYILKDEGKIDSVKEGKRRMWVTASIYAYIESLDHSQPEQPIVTHADGSKTQRW